MTEVVHIEILRRGPRAWNAWREHNPSQNPILDYAALSLGERQFGPINGGPINLRSASLRGAVLRFVTLSKLILRLPISLKLTSPTRVSMAQISQART